MEWVEDNNGGDEWWGWALGQGGVPGLEGMSGAMLFWLGVEGLGAVADRDVALIHGGDN